MRFAITCLLVCALFPMLPGHVRTGAMAGTMVDPDAGPVPLATVQSTELLTGRVYKAVSAANGSYAVAALPEGIFDITIPPIGFTFPKLERKGIQVQAGQTVKIELRLVWGGNLGASGDDISTLVRSKGRPSGPTPRTSDGKPDFSGVWVGNPAESEDASLLTWADAIIKERRARRRSRRTLGKRACREMSCSSAHSSIRSFRHRPSWRSCGKGMCKG